MFPIVIPIVGAVSSNVMIGGTVVAVSVGTAAVFEYKYKSVSSTMTYAYGVMTSWSKAKELTEEEIEQQQQDLLNETFNFLMEFTEKNEEEIDDYTYKIANILETNCKKAMDVVNEEATIKKNPDDIGGIDYINVLENKWKQIRDIKLEFSILSNDIHRFKADKSHDNDPKLFSNQQEHSKIINELNKRGIILKQISEIKARIMKIYTDRKIEKMERNMDVQHKISGPKV